MAEEKVTPRFSFVDALKGLALVILGGTGVFGYQKMPIINESTRIAESVETVKNLSATELAALQGVQVLALEKQLTKMETQILSQLKENEDRTTRRLEKHEEMILTNIKSIARLEALVPKARASNQ